MTTPVIFRKWKDIENHPVIAIFPTITWDERGEFCCSYEHVGQHGAADPFIDRTEPAQPEEYADLLEELQSIGYDDLVIYKRVQPWMHKTRRESVNF